MLFQHITERAVINRCFVSVCRTKLLKSNVYFTFRFEPASLKMLLSHMWPVVTNYHSGQPGSESVLISSFPRESLNGGGGGVG